MSRSSSSAMGVPGGYDRGNVAGCVPVGSRKRLELGRVDQLGQALVRSHDVAVNLDG
jgi:hypothetical protein